MTGGSKPKKIDFISFKTLPVRKSLGPRVYEKLKQAVVKGDIAPGSRVVEKSLADALGISRTPVREAIHKLEREGLLRHNRKGGYFVVGLTRAEIEESFGIRSILESYAARQAAIKHCEEELDPLEKKISEFQMYLDHGRLDVLPRINTEFHDLLYALSRSPRLVKMINNLKDEIYRFRRVILEKENMARISNEDHRLMLKFIQRRDAEGVERLVREHILRGKDFVLNEIKKGNLSVNE